MARRKNPVKSGLIDCMCRAGGGGPGRAQIGKLAFKALDFEPQRGAAREYQGHSPGGCVGLVVFHRQKVQHRVLGFRIDVAAAAGQHPIKPQRGAAALKTGRDLAAGFPVEPVDAENQPLFRREPYNVGDLDDRVLQMGGDDRDIVWVERNELEWVHGPALEVSRYWLIRKPRGAAQGEFCRASALLRDFCPALYREG